MIAPLLAALALAAPTPLPGPPAGLPSASRWQLDNGLRVVLIENRSLPWLELRLGFRIGSAADPIGKEGLASLTGTLLTTGVPGKDEQAIAEELARLGAALDVEVDAATLTLSGQVLTIDAAAARRFLELAADVTLAATLPDEALTRHRALALAGIRNLVDEPAALCQAAASAAALAGLAEARPTFGTLTGISAVTRDELVAFRDRALVPQHAVLVIAGSFEPDALLAWIAARLGAWGDGVTCERTANALPGTCTRVCKGGSCLANPTALPRAERPVAGPPQAPVVLVAMDDTTMEQVEWRYATANPVSVMAPEWAALRLGLHVLGGEYTSRLNRTLRERHGLTYGAYLSPDFGGWQSGVMAITTDATPAALDKSVGLGLELWRGMSAQAVPDEELHAIRDTLVNGFPFRFETVSHVLDQYTFVELADVPYSYLADYRARLGAVDAPAVLAAMRAVGTATRPVLVAVGPAATEETLARFGAVRVVKALDFLTNGL